jgi:hypothetical protein
VASSAHRNTSSAERKLMESRHWFKKAQRWRTDCEAVSVW